MKAYKVIAAVTIHSGKMELTPAQADAREHAVRRVEGKDDEYELLQATQFKAGEIVRIDEEIGKALKSQLEDATAENVKEFERQVKEQTAERARRKEQEKNAKEFARADLLARLGEVKSSVFKDRRPAGTGDSAPFANPSPPPSDDKMGGAHQKKSEIEKR